jgi:hypothetical protein
VTNVKVFVTSTPDQPNLEGTRRQQEKNLGNLGGKTKPK